MHLYTEWMYKSHVEDKNMQAVCCKQFLKDKWNFFKITKNSNGKRQLTRTKHCCGSMQTKLVKSFTLQQQQHTIWAFKNKKDPADRWGKLLSWCCQGCWIDAMNLKSLWGYHMSYHSNTVWDRYHKDNFGALPPLIQRERKTGDGGRVHVVDKGECTLHETLQLCLCCYL